MRTLAVAGKSDDEIRAYLVARYGDFVLYQPPFKATTWLLWFGPFALLARRRRWRGGSVAVRAAAATAPSEPAPTAGVERARELLRDARD